jgi:hypothetical protein
MAPRGSIKRHPALVLINFARRKNMPAILLWLLGVPIPIIILLILLWH